MLYTSQQAELLEQGVVRISPLFRLVLNTDEVIRLWAGFGNLDLPADTVETTNQAVYWGAGTLRGVPALQQLINGDADRVEFTLSGAAVSARVHELADSEAVQVRRARLNIGIVIFDETEQIAVPVKWIWEGVADSLNPACDASSGEEVRTLTLSVGSLLSQRRRPTPNYYTDVSQQARSTGDRFCQFTTQYRQDQPKPWPRA